MWDCTKGKTGTGTACWDSLTFEEKKMKGSPASGCKLEMPQSAVLCLVLLFCVSFLLILLHFLQSWARMDKKEETGMRHESLPHHHHQARWEWREA